MVISININPIMGSITMPADALTPKITRASGGKILPVWDRQHVFCSRVNFIYLGQAKYKYNSKCEYIFVIFKIIQMLRVKIR